MKFIMSTVTVCHTYKRSNVWCTRTYSYHHILASNFVIVFFNCWQKNRFITWHISTRERRLSKEADRKFVRLHQVGWLRGRGGRYDIIHITQVWISIYTHAACLYILNVFACEGNSQCELCVILNTNWDLLCRRVDIVHICYVMKRLSIVYIQLYTHSLEIVANTST